MEGLQKRKIGGPLLVGAVFLLAIVFALVITFGSKERVRAPRELGTLPPPLPPAPPAAQVLTAAEKEKMMEALRGR